MEGNLKNLSVVDSVPPRFQQIADTAVGSVSPLFVSCSVYAGESISAEDISQDKAIPVYGSNGVRGFTDEPNVLKDQVLVGRQGSVGTVHFAQAPFWASEHALIVEPRGEDVDKRWLKYILEVCDLARLSKAVAQPGINASSVAFQRIPHIRNIDQQRIADYLDRETAEIDAAVADLDRYVELLEKRRLLLISEAVAPPGVRNAPLKLDCKFVTSGSRGWAKYYAEKGTRFIRIADLQRGHYGFRDDSPQFVNIEDDSEGTRTRTRVGDLVFSITAYLGSIGVITKDQVDSFVSQHVALVRLHGRIWTPEFVAYTALGSAGQRYLTENSYGGTKSQLNLEQIQNFPVPYLPILEQLRVVDRLNTEVGELDLLIADSTKLRELLHKRRSVLITDVVTGRKQV
ncbi:restriction endonuclease subunit S [Corynebacterium glutamicum]|uniref:restriction endonuclease subunit S n=1 Tax=Corynebacterium glutamicum TaxID=1718 RepID=UPI000941F4AF|nr:restriction endonuclease subunit S [Corynebacterium glutamicum]OKX81682.1 hypothetical protein AUO95_07830 [Corynebacterium glutamicum]